MYTSVSLWTQKCLSELGTLAAFYKERWQNTHTESVTTGLISS